jgi:uncharacterized RDD family membrane protein YckC
MNWYYVDQGQQAGPVDDAQFEELVRSGKIQPDTLVWREGMAAWVSCREANAPSQSSGPPPAAAAGAVVGESPEAVCAECGKMFPIQDMIHHSGALGGVYICANCKPVFLQKLAEGAKINTGELPYAGFWTRFAAVFLDGLILFAVNFCISLIAGLSAAQAAGVQPKGTLALQLVLMAIQLAIGISYEVVFIGKYGATPGKMACKIMVVTADGGRVSYARSFGRYFAKLLSYMICLIGFIIAGFDSQKRALHDHICNTRVVFK